MSGAAGKPTKFLLTRVLTAAGAATIFVALWAAVATTGSAGKEASGTTGADEAEPIEQDGWRWDAASNQWVAIEQPAVAEAQEQVIVVERQPVYYYVRYVVEQPPAPAAVGTAASKPTAAVNAKGAAIAAPSGAPAEVPAAAPSSASPDAPVTPDATLPSPAVAPAAPGAPAPAPPAAAAPVVAAKPAPPAPAPAAPRKTKGS